MKLSIITINKDNAEGLQKTLDSVACQTWHDFEHIIVDGASADSSVDIIHNYAADVHPYPVKWLSEPDTGIYNAMNKGIRMANGEYCLFLNSGDYLYESQTLSKVPINDLNDDICWGRINYGSDEKGYEVVGIKDLQFSAFTLFHNSVPHQACFIRRLILSKVGGYDESYQIVSDLKFFYEQIVNKNNSISIIDIVISVVNDRGISSDIEKSKQEEDRLFLEYYPSRLLIDYHNWLNIKQENDELKRKISENRNAIYIFQSIKKCTFLRKCHTFLYKICKAFK